jgi:hypothetical protein
MALQTGVEGINLGFCDSEYPEPGSLTRDPAITGTQRIRERVDEK